MNPERYQPVADRSELDEVCEKCWLAQGWIVRVVDWVRHAPYCQVRREPLDYVGSSSGE